MEIKEIIKREIEEEIIKSMLCDNCKKEIENFGTCGYGAEYTLSDAWCSQCGGKTWHFCNINCLKEFVDKKCEEKE